MSYYILKMLGATGEDILRFKENIKELYIDKGMNVVSDNIKVLDLCIDNLRELDNHVLTVEEQNEEKMNSIYDKMMARRANMVKVSDFLNHKDGTFEGNMSKSDKRKISSLVPSWCKENCIECNLCSFICPHGVIKPFSMTKEEFDNSPLKEEDVIIESGRYFYLGINTDNCTGCTLCSKICPGKNKQKALTMDKPKENTDLLCDYLRENVKNDVNLPKTTVKALGFSDNKILFPGACAGCGETVYLRTLTSMYGDEIVISNATGCSSIYSSSLPCTPYKMPWISSLFEDNAEFGLGLHLSYKIKEIKLKEL